MDIYFQLKKKKKRKEKEKKRKKKIWKENDGEEIKGKKGDKNNKSSFLF